jgi:hypothetical protein
LNSTAKIKIRERILFSKVQDVSGGGASFEGPPAFDVGEALEIELEAFGSVPGALVRKWDDGYSVAFDLDDDDRNSLQEDMESFMRENDLRKD